MGRFSDSPEKTACATGQYRFDTAVPKKIRELIGELERAGFVNRGGRGRHRNFTHPLGLRVTLSGQAGSDAHRYPEKEVRRKIELTQP